MRTLLILGLVLAACSSNAQLNPPPAVDPVPIESLVEVQGASSGKVRVTFKVGSLPTTQVTSTSSGGVTHVTETSYGVLFGIANRTPSGSPQRAGTQKTYNSGAISATMYQIAAGDTIWVDLASTSSSSFDAIYHMIVAVTRYDIVNGVEGVRASDPPVHIISDYRYGLSRTTLTCASIDSRKGYGQPNLEGAFPGDPNAELANVNFNDWYYKGGLFVGNAFQGGADLSGTSRVQLLAGTSPFPSTGLRKETLALLVLGAPASFTGGPTVQLHRAAGPNLGLPPSSWNWSNKWEPAASSNLDNEPVQLPDTGPTIVNLPYKLAGTPVSFSMAILKLTDESPTSSNCWHYISNTPYVNKTNPTTYPRNQGDVRLWSLICEGEIFLTL